MKTGYLLVFVGYFCFGIGLLLGQALAQRPVYWIVALILAGLACMAILISLHRPRKKRLPVRRGSRLVATSRRGNLKVVGK
jgi:hypothetical protein